MELEKPEGSAQIAFEANSQEERKSMSEELSGSHNPNPEISN